MSLSRVTGLLIAFDLPKQEKKENEISKNFPPIIQKVYLWKLLDIIIIF